MKECPIGPLEFCSKEMIVEMLTSSNNFERIAVSSFDPNDERIEFIKNHLKNDTVKNNIPIVFKTIPKQQIKIAVLEEIFLHKFEKTPYNSATLAKTYVNEHFGVDTVGDFVEEVTLHDVTFDSLIQASPAIDELKTIFQNILEPSSSQAYKKFGIRNPKGILLSGPTGSGKSTLAKAVCSFCSSNWNIRSFSLNPSAVLSKYFGDSEANLRRAFKQLRQIAISQPVLFVMDGFMDVIGRGRKGGSFEARILSTFLNELDGIDTVELPLIVLATTLDYRQLDEALVRPGRFDHLVDVGRGFDSTRFLSHWKIPNPDSQEIGTPSEAIKYVEMKIIEQLIV